MSSYNFSKRIHNHHSHPQGGFMNKPMISVFLVLFSLLGHSSAVSQIRVGKLGIGARGEGYLFQAKSAQKTYNTFGGGLDVNYSLWENVGLRAAVGTGSLESKDSSNTINTTSLFYGNLFLSGDFMPHSSFNIFVFAGGGMYYADPRVKSTGVGRVKGGWKTSLSGGAGLDWFLSEFVSVTLAGEYVLGGSSVLDGVAGGGSDSYQRITFGVRYYFFDEGFITKMLKALEERYRK
jgi:opacity protein-like surface antigen